MTTVLAAALGMAVAASANAGAAPPAGAAEAAFPKPAGFVNDYAGVLAPAERERLEAEIRALERETGAELAVAVVPRTAPETPKMYAVKLFERWGVGKRGRDNGALLLVALEERRVEVEVGYGLEGVLPDALVGRILDERVVPLLRRGDVAGGVAAGVAALAERVRAALPAGPQPGPQGPGAAGGGLSAPSGSGAGGKPGAGLPVAVAAIAAVLAFAAIAAAVGRRRRRCPRCGGRLTATRQVLREATPAVPGEWRRVVACTRCDYHREEFFAIPWFPPGDGSAPGGFGGGFGFPGGWRGGRGWGGFRGFGGGRSGGGGAGRSW